MTIRPFCEDDRPALHRVTIACFEKSMHVAVEQLFGPPKGIPWQSRKVADVDGDLATNPEGVLVAEMDGQVVGFVTALLHPKTDVGHIGNLAVDPGCQRSGIGTALLGAALDYLAARGMTHARIETLENNLVGRHLYPKMGFREIARQIYYMMELPSQGAAEPGWEPEGQAHGGH